MVVDKILVKPQDGKQTILEVKKYLLVKNNKC